MVIVYYLERQSCRVLKFNMNNFSSSLVSPFYKRHPPMGTAHLGFKIKCAPEAKKYGI